jgi:hypothetical protein
MGHSYYMVVMRFLDTIPSDAVIADIEFKVKRRADSAVGDYSVRLVKEGAIVGRELRSVMGWNEGADRTDIYRTGPDLGGVEWTADDINSMFSGVGIAAVAPDASAPRAYINYVARKVYYVPKYTIPRDIGGRSYIRRSFIVRYNGDDCLAIATGLLDNRLSVEEAALSLKIMNGGFDSWNEGSPIEYQGDPDVREVTINHPDVTIPAMSGLIRQISQEFPEYEYLGVLADDMDNGGAEYI